MAADGIHMTMKYAHIGIDDQAKAVANLPTAALHGRCISGVSGGQSPATPGTNATGNGRHSVAKIAKVEDRGLEPLGDFDATEYSASTSDDGQPDGAARALHSRGTGCRCLSSLDVDLQSVVAGWDCLPKAIRKAIVGLATSQG